MCIMSERFIRPASRISDRFYYDARVGVHDGVLQYFLWLLRRILSFLIRCNLNVKITTPQNIPNKTSSYQFIIRVYLSINRK